MAREWRHKTIPQMAQQKRNVRVNVFSLRAYVHALLVLRLKEVGERKIAFRSVEIDKRTNVVASMRAI